MLVTFHSEAYANITMFGDVAVRLIKLMGYSGAIPGAIYTEDVPEALIRLKTAVTASGAAPAMPKRGDAARDVDKEEAVSLAQRAFPLMEMLEASIKAKCGVMWEK